MSSQIVVGIVVADGNYLPVIRVLDLSVEQSALERSEAALAALAEA